MCQSHSTNSAHLQVRGRQSTASPLFTSSRPAVLATTDKSLSISTPVPSGGNLQLPETAAPWQYGQMQDGPAILARHERIAAKYGVQAPYWSAMADCPIASYEAYSRGSLQVVLGRIGSYPAETLAVWIDAAMRSYIEQGALGSAFPRSDSRLLEQLAATLIGGFDENRLIGTVFLSERERPPLLMGGCMAVIGQKDATVRTIMGTKAATLPTLIALTLPEAQPEGCYGAVVDGNELHAIVDASEREVVCYTGLFRLPTRLVERRTCGNRSTLKNWSKEMLSGMPRIVQSWADENGRRVRFGLIDSSVPTLTHTVTRHYGAKTWVTGVEPTASMHRNLHGRHYVAFKSSISIVYMDFAQQLARARQVDAELGPKKRLP
jgi:hypothetical protein